jgi:hypothetical protein
MLKEGRAIERRTRGRAVEGRKGGILKERRDIEGTRLKVISIVKEGRMEGRVIEGREEGRGIEGRGIEGRKGC